MSDYKKYVLSYFLNMSKNRELSEELAGLAAFKHVSCRESILEAGHRTNYICLVVSGLVRGFYIDEEGLINMCNTITRLKFHFMRVWFVCFILMFVLVRISKKSGSQRN